MGNFDTVLEDALSSADSVDFAYEDEDGEIIDMLMTEEAEQIHLF